MKININNGTIESVNVSLLSSNEFDTIYNIERDTWSHFMGEYLKCDTCNISFSKSDIYLDIDSDYSKKTLLELENKYGREGFNCTCCESKLTDIRGKELYTILDDRLTKSKHSFVNYYKNNVGEILGFTYGFVDSPEETYLKEYKYHFNDRLLNLFTEKFGKQDLLTLSGVCLYEKDKNIKVIYELIKYFHCLIPDYFNGITGTGEAIKATSAHKIYKKNGAKSLDIDDNFYLNNSIEKNSDIVFQENVVDAYKSIINENLMSFLRLKNN